MYDLSPAPSLNREGGFLIIRGCAPFRQPLTGKRRLRLYPLVLKPVAGEEPDESVYGGHPKEVREARKIRRLN